MKSNEYILYGLTNRKEIIDKIIAELNADDDYFDIRLILTEALTNAFKHGNKSNMDKPIYLRYVYSSKNVKFEIEDSGTEYKNITIPDEVSDENLLNDCGRGLFLIKCMADKIEFKNNTLMIQKNLTAMKCIP